MIGVVAILRVLIRSLRELAREPEGRGLISSVFILIAGGAIFYRQVEGFSWLDSFYFTVVTLTTVGYGDLAPTTAAGKIFTMVYLLIGIGLLVAFATQLSGRFLSLRQRDRRGAGRGDGPGDGLGVDDAETAGDRP